MDTAKEPRSAEERRRDVLERLRTEEDIWVASASADGLPHLVPLWFLWDGAAMWMSTRLTTPTGRNLRETGRARLALSPTRDVVLIDGRVETFTAEEVPTAAADAFVRKWGWDPRKDHASYGYFKVLPQAIQAWQGEHEIKGRFVMRDGEWTGGWVS